MSRISIYFSSLNVSPKIYNPITQVPIFRWNAIYIDSVIDIIINDFNYKISIKVGLAFFAHNLLFSIYPHLNARTFLFLIPKEENKKKRAKIPRTYIFPYFLQQTDIDSSYKSLTKNYPRWKNKKTKKSWRKKELPSFAIICFSSFHNFSLFSVFVVGSLIRNEINEFTFFTLIAVLFAKC